MSEQIRAAELTADALGRTVRIETGGRESLRGRPVRIRHKLVRDESETRRDLEAGEQRVTAAFNAIGVVELL